MANAPTREDAAAELLRRRKALESLHEFCRQAWPQVEGGREFQDNWHIGAICEHLEAVTNGQIRNLLINIPPRMTKSTMVGIMWPAWAWLHDPGIKWMFSTFAHVLTLRDSRRCRALMTSKWYQTRWANKFSFIEDFNTLVRFDNDKGGYRIATSVDTQTMGDGGDIIVCDDTNNTRDSSDTMLDSTIDWWTTVMPTRLNSFKTARRVVMQQRTHERDHSGYILSTDPDSWVKLILPMEFETKRRCVTVPLPSTGGKPWMDPRTVEGELLDANRIGQKELKQLKKELGSVYAISGQLQQRPSPAAGGMILRSWFQLWKSSDPPQLSYTLMSIDTAMSERKEAAYSAATTWGVFTNDQGVPCVILMATWREQCEYPELRSRIQRLSRNYLDDGPGIRNDKLPPDLVLIEAKSSGVSLLQDLRRAGVMAHGFNPDKMGDKVQRVRLVTPLLESGRVYVPARADRDPNSGTIFYNRPRAFADTFIDQCTRFPKGDSRDMVDTMSMGLWKIMQSGFVWNRDDEGPREPDYRSEQNTKQAIY